MEPIIIAVVQITCLGMGIADAPAGDDFLFHIGDVIAICVFQEKEAWRLRDDEPAIHEDKSGGYVKPFGESGEFVSLAVAVGVFANTDPVTADAVGFDSVRVVISLGKPTPTPLVPGHRDRFADLGVTRKKLESHVGRDLGALHRALGAVRLLKSEGLGTFLIVGDMRVFYPVLRFALGEEGLVAREPLLPDTPEDASLEKLMELRQTPDTLVMTGGGVKNAAFSLRPDPSPGLVFSDIIVGGDFTDLKHDPIREVVTLVHIGLIPCRKTGDIPDCGVVRVYRFRAKNTRLVMGETGSDDLFEFGNILKTPTRTMHRDKSSALLDERFQMRPVSGIDLRMIGV